jgi:hypothetical protein
MADSKVTNLTAKTTLDGTEELYANDGGADKKVGTDDLLKPLNTRNDYITGSYFGTTAGYTTGTDNITADYLFAFPVCIPFNQNITRISINVTLGAAGNARLGIYDSAAGLPANLVLDAGEVDVSSTGIKTIAINQTLSGFHFVAITSDVAPTLSSHTHAGQGESMGYAAVTGSMTSRCYHARSYAALPDPFGASPTLATGETFKVLLGVD